MGSLIQILLFVIIGIFMLWFGYTLFFGIGNKVPAWQFNKGGKRRKEPVGIGYPGAPQTCPVCSARLEEGELVKSAAFPSFTGKDRLMHIKGCVYCLHGDRQRICPVCGTILNDDEILIARMFERPGRSHVHVLGCSCCRGPGQTRQYS